jgi:ketosteroid isomerase-like protein
MFEDENGPWRHAGRGLSGFGAAAAIVLGLSACATPAAAPPPAPAPLAPEELSSHVAATELAFANTLRDRDFAAFQRFIDEQAVFRASQSRLLHGRAAIAAEWQKYFTAGGPPPFSWQPDSVTVDQSGTLAVSTGPVLDGSGKTIARFTSIWRRVGAGTGIGDWRIIVDQGVTACDCAKH